MAQRPSGWAELAAYGRGGLKDLQDRVVNPWHGHAAQHAETGQLGNPAQREVYGISDGDAPAREPDPLDVARDAWREQVQEASRDKGKERGIEP